jgi:hypothetical protein
MTTSAEDKPERSWSKEAMPHAIVKLWPTVFSAIPVVKGVFEKRPR